MKEARVVIDLTENDTNEPPVKKRKVEDGSSRSVLGSKASPQYSHKRPTNITDWGLSDILSSMSTPTSIPFFGTKKREESKKNPELKKTQNEISSAIMGDLIFLLTDFLSKQVKDLRKNTTFGVILKTRYQDAISLGNEYAKKALQKLYKLNSRVGKTDSYRKMHNPFKDLNKSAIENTKNESQCLQFFNISIDDVFLELDLTCFKNASIPSINTYLPSLIEYINKALKTSDFNHISDPIKDKIRRFLQTKLNAHMESENQNRMKI